MLLNHRRALFVVTFARRRSWVWRWATPDANAFGGALAPTSLWASRAVSQRRVGCFDEPGSQLSHKRVTSGGPPPCCPPASVPGAWPTKRNPSRSSFRQATASSRSVCHRRSSMLTSVGIDNFCFCVLFLFVFFFLCFFFAFFVLFFVFFFCFVVFFCLFLFWFFF